jgi:hypothetical protein
MRVERLLALHGAPLCAASRPSLRCAEAPAGLSAAQGRPQRGPPLRRGEPGRRPGPARLRVVGCAGTPSRRAGDPAAGSDGGGAGAAGQGGVEVSPVCSIVGGMAADQLIKAVTGRERPLRNLFIYDGRDGMGAVYDLPAA